MRRVSLHRGSKNLSSPSNISTCSSFSRRCSLLPKFHESSSSVHHQRSRANFDSQEKRSSNDLKSSSDHFGFRSPRIFSVTRLSVISCYENATLFDHTPSSENIFNPNEIEIVSKNSGATDAEKYVSSCSPDYDIKCFVTFETKTNSSPCQNSVDRSTSQHSTSNFFHSVPSLISYFYQQNGIGTDIQERSHLRKDSLHLDSQSHSTNHSPAIAQQHPSKSVTSPVLQNVGFSSFYKNTRSFIPFQNEVTTDYFEDEDIADSSQDEDRSSRIEIPKIRSPQTFTFS